METQLIDIELIARAIRWGGHYYPTDDILREKKLKPEILELYDKYKKAGCPHIDMGYYNFKPKYIKIFCNDPDCLERRINCYSCNTKCLVSQITECPNCDNKICIHCMKVHNEPFGILCKSDYEWLNVISVKGHCPGCIEKTICLCGETYYERDRKQHFKKDHKISEDK